MSTEFIRCSACRSLIPAVSKMCRMCGAELAGGATRSDEEAIKKSGRVRQRTMSQSNEELARAAQQLRADFVSDQVDHDPIPASSDGNVDPLSAYIEEIDSGIIPTMGVAAERSANSAIATGMIGAEVDAEKTVAVNPEQFESPKPKVIVESGARKAGKPSGLSFARPKENNNPVQEPQQHQATEAKEPREPRLESRSGLNLSKSTNKDARSVSKRDHDQTAADSNAETRHHEKVIEKSAENLQSSSQTLQTFNKNVLKSKQIPLKGLKSSAGRLVGWLVSYRESDGSAIELREGRFFVTRSSVKESDLVIDHESISTPHALIHITAETGMRIHDVISEKGLYIKRKGSSDYQKTSETVEVKHGDQIRFGEVEYQVCLIAEVGAV